MTSLILPSCDGTGSVDALVDRGEWMRPTSASVVHGATCIAQSINMVRPSISSQAFFRKALVSNGNRFPRTVTLDGHRPSRAALWKLRMEHVRWRHGKVRTCQYLNNIVEQDLQSIRARYGTMKCFKSFANAAITLAGLELAHRIRKHPFSFGRAYRFGRNRMRDWGIALA